MILFKSWKFASASRAVLLAGLMTTTAMPAFATDVPNAASPSETPNDDVIVTARRDAETASRGRQEAAPNIIQTISQEEIRKLPDINAGEAIARLPGAALSVDTGQGRWINIRGLDADLTSTTYAGIHLPPTNPVTPQNGGRAFAFDAFPTGMIGTMTITKTNTPSQDAEALGGTVEISPKAIPLGRTHYLEVRAGSGEQFSRHTAVVDLAASGGLRFGGSGEDKPFSLVVSASYYKDALGTDDRRASFSNSASQPNLAWSNMTQAYYQFHRATKGAAAEFAYQPDADTRFYARYLYSGYVEDVSRNRFVVKTSGTSVQKADGSITSNVKQFDKTLRDLQERVSLNVATIGGENRFGALKLDYHLAYAEGRDYRPHDTIATFTAKPTGASITYNQAGYNYPTYTIAGTNAFDSSAYSLTGVTDNTQLYRTREWTGGINATLPTHLFGQGDEALQFGVTARLRSNTHAFNPYTSTGVPTTSLSSVVSGSPVYYYQNHYANGQNIGVDAVRTLFAGGTGAGFTTSTASNAFAGGAIQQDNKENVYAGYAQEHVTLGKLSLLGGVRVETTRARYSGNTSVPTGTAGATAERGGNTISANGSTLIPVASRANYTNVFGSLQARYELQHNVILRASYSSTIARPGFNQIDPAATIDVANNLVSTGNPNLKPIISNNFDLSAEAYLPHGGIVSISGFDKELSNYIFGRTVFGGITDPVILATLGTQPTQTQVVTYGNISHARAIGFELSYDQKFSFLPGLLGNFGTNLNYTFVDASGQIRAGENGPLPSTSRNNYNAALYWEDDRFSLRGAVSYVDRSLLFVGATRAADQYTEDRLSFDMSASYAVRKDVSLYIAGRNLLNTAHTITEGAQNRVIQREMFGSAVMGGVTFKM